MKHTRPKYSPPSDAMQKHPEAPDFGRLGRRGFLGVALGGTAFAGMAGEVLAQNKVPPLGQVERRFFDADEWTMILTLCDTLIPAEGEGPGGLEARVPVFLDRLLADDWGAAHRWYMKGPFQPDADPNKGFQSPLTPADIYRKGLAHFDAWCSDNHDSAFVDLNGEARVSAVDALMSKETGLPPELRDFPDFLLLNVKQGYLSDPKHGGNHNMAAWVYIGYPGARANFLSWTNPERDEAHYPLGPVSIAGERA